MDNTTVPDCAYWIERERAEEIGVICTVGDGTTTLVNDPEWYQATHKKESKFRQESLCDVTANQSIHGRVGRGYGRDAVVFWFPCYVFCWSNTWWRPFRWNQFLGEGGGGTSIDPTAR